MKRVSFLLFGFIFIGLYLFIYDPNSSFKEQEIKQTQFFSVIKPIWKIQIQNTKDSYELNSLKALQEENKEVFLLDEPIFSELQNQIVDKIAEYKNEILYLKAQDPAWRQEISLQTTEIIDRMNRKLKNTKIKKIQLR